MWGWVAILTPNINHISPIPYHFSKEVMKTRLYEAFARTFEEMPAHAKTLLGQRCSGSQWSYKAICNTQQQLLNFLRGFEFMYSEDQRGSEVLFYKQEFENLGTIGIVTAEYIGPENIVRVIETAHGKCLGVEHYQDSTIMTDEAWCIVGNEPGIGEVIFTLYPGPVTKKIPQDFFINRPVGEIISQDLIDPEWAIKVIG